MSVEALAIVLHHSKARGTAKLILLGIANHAGDGGAWPSKATLARYANCTPQTVRKHVQTLRSLGEVRVHVNAGGLADEVDYLRPNRYDVLVSCPPWCDRTTQHRDTRKGRAGTLSLFPAPVEKPGVGTDPGSDLIPDPGIGTDPLTVPSTGDNKGSGSVTGPRATCAVCSNPRDVCRAADARLAPGDRHDYTPRGPR